MSLGLEVDIKSAGNRALIAKALGLTGGRGGGGNDASEKEGVGGCYVGCVVGFCHFVCCGLVGITMMPPILPPPTQFSRLFFTRAQAPAR